jgi:hypothetical protein
MFGGRLVVVSRVIEEFQQPATHAKIGQHFGGFFIKVQAIGRKKRVLYKPPAEE